MMTNGKRDSASKTGPMLRRNRLNKTEAEAALVVRAASSHVKAHASEIESLAFQLAGDVESIVISEMIELAARLDRLSEKLRQTTDH